MLLLWSGNPTGHWADIATTAPARTSGWLISQNRAMSTMRHHLTGKKWAADNERFSLTREFKPHAFLSFCQRLPLYPGECLFITVPDQMGDANATAKLWEQYAPQMHTTDLPLAYVAQDGLTRLPDVTFQCLFIGGTTGYKLGPEARQLATLAHDARKWVHVGRVNSFSRLLYCWHIGADSVDGTGWTRRSEIELRRLTHFLDIIDKTDRLREQSQ